MENTKCAMLHDVVVLRNVTEKTMQKVAELPVLRPEMTTPYAPKAGDLTLLLYGGAKICRRDGDRVIPLNRLQAGACFGLASLYSDSMPDTEVNFYGGARIVVIPREMLEELIMEDAVFARNIIAKLSEKVRFLNTKIAGYTAHCGVDKLYRHLDSFERDAEGYVDTGESTTSLARRLGISRVSLYRAIDSLMADGKIYREGRRYKMLCPKKVEEEI